LRAIFVRKFSRFGHRAAAGGEGHACIFVDIYKQMLQRHTGTEAVRAPIRARAARKKQEFTGSGAPLCVSGRPPRQDAAARHRRRRIAARKPSNQQRSATINNGLPVHSIRPVRAQELSRAALHPKTLTV
jgi:hypothetical protein